MYSDLQTKTAFYPEVFVAIYQTKGFTFQNTVVYLYRLCSFDLILQQRTFISKYKSYVGH